MKQTARDLNFNLWVKAKSCVYSQESKKISDTYQQFDRLDSNQLGVILQQYHFLMFCF